MDDDISSDLSELKALLVMTLQYVLYRMIQNENCREGSLELLHVGFVLAKLLSFVNFQALALIEWKQLSPGYL